MRANEIRELRDAVPFRPFRLHLADGRSIPVYHRDFLMSAPSGRTVVVYQRDDSFDIVDVMLVVSLHIMAPNGRTKTRAGVRARRGPTRD